ncbi:MAG: hypothetical protein WC862_01585 [Patescibacteria group bacterium]
MTEKIYPIKLYVKNLPNLVMLCASILLNLAAWFWLFWNIRSGDGTVFLHYNILFGVDYIGEWWKIVFLPATGILILILNTILGWILFQRDSFMTYLLNATSLLCQIFLFITASLLVFLNV